MSMWEKLSNPTVTNGVKYNCSHVHSGLHHHRRKWSIIESTTKRKEMKWLRNSTPVVYGLNIQAVLQDTKKEIFSELQHAKYEVPLDDTLRIHSDWGDLIQDGYTHACGPGARSRENIDKIRSDYDQYNISTSEKQRPATSIKTKHMYSSVNLASFDSKPIKVCRPSTSIHPLRQGLVMLNRDPKNTPLAGGTQ